MSKSSQPDINRRQWLAAAAGLSAATTLPTPALADAPKTARWPTTSSGGPLHKGLQLGLPERDYRPVRVPGGAKLAWKIVDGVKVFHLVAEEVEHEFAPGLKAKCWGYNGHVHGPVIEAVEGRSRAGLRQQPPAGPHHRALARRVSGKRHG